MEHLGGKRRIVFDDRGQLLCIGRAGINHPSDLHHDHGQGGNFVNRGEIVQKAHRRRLRQLLFPFELGDFGFGFAQEKAQFGDLLCHLLDAFILVGNPFDLRLDLLDEEV